ncbi:Uncharacterised protein [uncultured Clostridium sp.]|nr:Uncharacterised protein [uncultured Clostridium sp.]
MTVTLDSREKEIINLLCVCSMNASEAARRSYCHRNTIMYYIQKIKTRTGLNPLCYRDLRKLEEAAKD